jgi:hypothetical protein
VAAVEDPFGIYDEPGRSTCQHDGNDKANRWWRVKRPPPSVPGWVSFRFCSKDCLIEHAETSAEAWPQDTIPRLRLILGARG